MSGDDGLVGISIVVFVVYHKTFFVGDGKPFYLSY